jgi:antitoxin FitA
MVSEASLASSPAIAIIDSMAQLIVRNIEEEVVEALKLRAAQHGRSAEAEHRELLRQALLRQPSASLKEHLMAMPDVGTDVDFETRREGARKVEL